MHVYQYRRHFFSLQGIAQRHCVIWVSQATRAQQPYIQNRPLHKPCLFNMTFECDWLTKWCITHCTLYSLFLFSTMHIPHMIVQTTSGWKFFATQRTNIWMFVCAIDMFFERFLSHTFKFTNWALIQFYFLMITCNMVHPLRSCFKFFMAHGTFVFFVRGIHLLLSFTLWLTMWVTKDK